jgi:exodeoxyribonuclease V alpha subunit
MLSLEGRWLNQPKYGLQFEASQYTSHLPAATNAIKRYLSSNLVKGIGPVMAGRLVDRFGEETLQVIEENPQRLSEIRGIGPHRIKSIQGAREELREVREMMLLLQGHGIGSTYATCTYKTYGSDSITVVRENPYRLA